MFWFQCMGLPTTLLLLWRLAGNFYQSEVCMFIQPLLQLPEAHCSNLPTAPKQHVGMGGFLISFSPGRKNYWTVDHLPESVCVWWSPVTINQVMNCHVLTPEHTPAKTVPSSSNSFHSWDHRPVTAHPHTALYSGHSCYCPKSTPACLIL